MEHKVYTAPPLYGRELAFPFLDESYTVNSRLCNIIPIQVHTDATTVAAQRDHYETARWRTDARVVLTSLWWTDDGVDTEPWIREQLDRYGWIRHPVTYLHTNTALEDSYDMLWNRHKRYFTEWTQDLAELHWTQGYGKSMYELAAIPMHKNVTTLYLSPTRIYPQHLANNNARMILRRKLLTRLARYPGIHTGTDFIAPQEETAHGWKLIKDLNGSIWQPCHNRYYEQTYFSTYVETLVGNGCTRTITEKTLDPLIKGHFILPYGYLGMIDDIVSMGFQLPDFINYGYSRIENPTLRWRAFVNELARIMRLDWPTLYAKNRHLLEHNRQVFYSRPYSKWDK